MVDMMMVYTSVIKVSSNFVEYAQAWILRAQWQEAHHPQFKGARDHTFPESPSSPLRLLAQRKHTPPLALGPE